MNFIAHIQLSGQNEELLVGNYISDLIRQIDLIDLSPAILTGVYLHRKIDEYTDHHKVNKNILSSIYPRHSKYASVLLDIYYDYILIKNWSRFDERSFESVCELAYRALEKYLESIPVSAQSNIKNLLNKRWLETAYGSKEGLEKTFYFLGKRMSRPELIMGATDTLLELESQIESSFLEFYPSLVNRVVQWK